MTQASDEALPYWHYYKTFLTLKHLGHLISIILLAANACVAGLLLLSAYSPYVSPVQHAVLSCLGLAFPIFAILNAGFLLLWLCIQQYKSALLPLVAFLACLPQLRDYCPLNFSTDSPPSESRKILSYNIMGFAKGVKESGENPVLEYLKESGADVLCLQEYHTYAPATHVTQNDVDRALKAYPYHHIGHVGTGRSNRVACYSKLPILSARELPTPSAYNGVMMYELKWDNDTVLLLNAHLESNKLTRSDKAVYENMLTSPEKETVKSGLRLLIRKLAKASALRAPQADSIAHAVAGSRYRYIVVCGDFNDTAISYAHRVIAGQLDDAFSESGFGLGISYHQNRFLFRIDHILTSKSLQPYNCTVDRSVQASDHYPIWCYLAKKQ